MNLKRIAFIFLAVFLLSGADLFAQKIKVSGTVLDDEGLPFPGAGIIEVGTKNGAISDLNGNFTLSVQPGAELEFPFIGYEPIREKVGNRNVAGLKIVFQEKNNVLDEVVVIGYGSQKKVALTGSVSSVESEDLAKSAGTNLANALAGNISGFSSIQMSGQPGADDPTIFVRGIGSLDAARATPLMMVDGVERSFYRLDPNEVESITVLKDASATAVFGVRGANGVILVTTKRGAAGKMSVSMSSEAGFQKPIRLYQYCNSYEYGMVYNESRLNDDPTLTPDELPFKEHVLQAFKDHSQPLIYPDTDWQDYLLKDAAFQMKNNISVSGGTDNVRFFTSIGVVNQDGLYKSFDTDYDSNIRYNRYNWRANLDIDITKTTTLSINMGGRIEDNRIPITKDNGKFDPQLYFALPFAGAGLYEGKWIRGAEANLPFTSGALQNGDAFEQYYGRGYQRTARNEVNLDLILKQRLDFITRGLTFSAKGSYNGYFIQTKKWSKTEPFYTAHLDEDDEIFFRRQREATSLSYSESTGKGRDWYLEASLNYDRTFSGHHIGGLILYNQWKQQYPGAAGYTYPAIPRGYVGLVGRVTYDYKSKYLLDFNVGYNGSENFAPGKRYGLFPAVSAGWVLSEEKWMKAIKPLSFLKVRASVGLVGNDIVSGKERFFYMPAEYNANGTGYNFGTGTTTLLPSAVEKKIGNPKVTWEKSLKLTVGVDYRFFKNRLSGSLDVFSEKRRDILSTVNTTPVFVAVSLPVVNLGKVNNKGFEVELGWKDKIGKSFNYRIKANVSYAHNTIIEMDEVPREYDWLVRTGRSVGQNFGYVFDGFVTKEDLDSGTLPDHHTELHEGDAKYKDLNGDGIISDVDMKSVGYSIYPELNGGLTLGFGFKGWDFSMLWNGAAMVSRYINNDLRIPFGKTQLYPLQRWIYEGRWTPETAGTATLPRVSTGSAVNNFEMNSTLWLRDASYLRLRNVTLSYSLPSKLLKKAAIRGVRFHVTAENLWTLDYYKISDPENTNRSYPLQTTITGGINLSF